MNKNETALEMCLRMLKERAKYWSIGYGGYEAGMSVGYESAVTMLEYAMQNNIECLRQLDYYPEDKEEK